VVVVKEAVRGMQDIRPGMRGIVSLCEGVGVSRTLSHNCSEERGDGG
jgi:hypothetical protein